MRWLILVSALVFVALPATAQKRIALTFDDIPRLQGAFYTPDERAQKLIEALRKARVRQAAFFLNPGDLAKAHGAGGEARIAAYVKAGHLIANHTNTHPALSATSAEDYLADIDAAEVWLKWRPGHRPWFRFPYLDEGGTDKVKRDAIRAGLAARGLRNGYVTVPGGDYALDELSIKAKNDGREMDMKQLARLFVLIHVSSAEHSDALARKALGRSPAHVMLLHETDLTTMFLVDIVAELRRLGWTIISADEAYRDPLRTAFPDVPNARGNLIGAMAWEKDIEPPVWPIWIDPGIATYIFNQRVLKKAVTP